MDADVAHEGLGWHHNPGGRYCWEEGHTQYIE